MIGAGSGIAPYLPLLEEIIRFDNGKSNKYDFNSATLIFIAREGEQVSWISNYLFHFLSTDFINSYLKIKIYITLKKNSETVPSFLFWRSLVLTTRQNVNQQTVKEEEKEDNKVEIMHRNDASGLINSQTNKDSHSSSAVQINFGRPDFTEVFKELAGKKEKLYNVYACVPEVLSNHLHTIIYDIKKETGVKFKLTLEEFS